MKSEFYGSCTNSWPVGADRAHMSAMQRFFFFAGHFDPSENAVVLCVERPNTFEALLQ